MKLLSSSIVFLIATFCLNAQSPLGLWKTVDDTDGAAKSYIEIHEIGGNLFATVRELLPAADKTHCDVCKGDKKDAPIVGMTLMRDMEKDGKEWSGGYILDPSSGKEYKCIIKLDGDDKLKVRGYIGTPLLGRTQYWYRK
jgi:uncharacterized protein (DUF2147 family)